MNRLDIQRRHEVSCDVTLVSKSGSEFKANRNELSAVSPFFSALFNSNMKENKEGIVRLDHITDTVVRDVLKYMHSGSVVITQENVQDLIEAADYLLLTNLQTIAGRFMEKKLSTSNCISIYYFAEKYHCEELVVNTRWFILLNFTAVAESQDFLNLESQEVERWISSDDIAVTTEDDVLKTIFTWIEENKSEREGKLEELIRHVRLDFVSRDYFERDVVTNSLVKENSGCLKLVGDAMKGIYCTTNKDLPQPPRNWWHTHIVALTERHTLCYDPNEEKWYYLRGPPRDFGRYNLLSFQGKLYVFEIENRHDTLHSFLYDPCHNHWVRLNWDFSQFKPKALLTVVVRGEMYAVIDTECFSRTPEEHEENYIVKYNVESNSWELVSSILFDGVMSVSGACAVAMDKYLYLIGGWQAYSDFVIPTRSACRFDTIEKK